MKEIIEKIKTKLLEEKEPDVVNVWASALQKVMVAYGIDWDKKRLERGDATNPKR